MFIALVGTGFPQIVRQRDVTSNLARSINEIAVVQRQIEDRAGYEQQQNNENRYSYPTAAAHVGGGH